MLHRSIFTAYRSNILSRSIQGILFTTACLTVPVIATANNQDTNTTQQITIAANSLDQALAQFAGLSGVQLSYDPALVQGKTSKGLKGQYHFEQGIAELLKGTGLMLVKRADGVWTIEQNKNQARDMGQLRTIDVNGIGGAPIAADPNAVQLNPIIVTAEDDTVTENSGSYTTKAMSVATKMATSLKKTPRSVSVISNQQLKDQGLEGKNLEETLRYTPGITLDDTTLASGDEASIPRIYSRGQRITNIQIDGLNYDLSGAVENAGSWGGTLYNRRSSGLLALPDMMLFDHVEMVRGPNSVFSGNGTPSATMNMVKKRPLKQQQVILEGSTSSWDSNLETGNYRATLDVTSPLSILDDRLRVRFLASQQDGAASFQDHHKSKRETLYGAIEFDLTQDTLLGVNYSHESIESTGLPIRGGLPRYHWGGDIGLAVRTNLTSKDAHSDTNSESTNLYITHKFNDDWTLDINASHSEQDLYSQSLSYVSSNIYEDGSGAIVRFGNYSNKKIQQDNFDIKINGKFKILDRDITLLAGIDHKNQKGKTTRSGIYSTRYAIEDLLSYDWNQYPEGPLSTFTRTVLSDKNKETGIYSSIKANIFDPLNIIITARKATFSSTSLFEQDGIAFNPVSYLSHSTKNSKQPITPTYSVTYDINDNLTSYVSYSESYQDQSTLREGKYDSTTNVYTLGKLLDPAIGKNYELGLNGEFINGRLNTYAVIYYMKRTDIASYDYVVSPSGDALESLEYCCFVNSGEQESKGIDLGISGEVYSGLQLNAGYTYNKNKTTSSAVNYEDTASTKTHTRTPEHQLKFFASYQPKGRLEDWRFGLGAVIQSSAFSEGTEAEYLGHDPDYIWTDSDGNITGKGRDVWSNDSYYANDANGGYNSGDVYTLPFNFTQDGYATWNAMVDWQATKNLSLTFNANNIFDKRYYRTIGTSTSGNYYGEPRNFSLTARLKF